MKRRIVATMTAEVRSRPGLTGVAIWSHDATHPNAYAGTFKPSDTAIVLSQHPGGEGVEPRTQIKLGDVIGWVRTASLDVTEYTPPPQEHVSAYLPYGWPVP